MTTHIQFHDSDTYRRIHTPHSHLMQHSINSVKGQHQRGEGANYKQLHYHVENGPGSFDMPRNPNLHPTTYEHIDIKSIPNHHQNLHYTYHDIRAGNPYMVNKVGYSMTLHQ